MERIKNYAIALFLCLVLLLQGCLKVDEESFYAFHTGEATLTEAGVAFEATIDKNFAQNAREFGVEYKFVYGDDDSDTWKRIVCQKALQNNSFTTLLEFLELEKNKTNPKGELLSQIKYVAYCDFSWSEEIAEERTFQITLCRLTAKSSDEGKGLITGSGTYCKGSSATITATPKENYYFTGWSDCDSRELTRTVQVNSDSTITAIFSEKPYLTAKPNNSDYGTVTGSGHYAVGSEATITATPKENCYFTGWSDCDSKELTRIVQVNSDSTITAIFSEKPYLTAKPNNSDYGTVTGSGHYAVGFEATITATPKENCYFTGWSDCDSKELTRIVQVNSDTTIIANFAKKPYLTAKPNNSNYGTVTGSGYYEVGTKVTITATPKENYYFTGWSDCDNRELTRTVQVNSDSTITAIFSEKPYLTAKPNNSDYGTVTGSGHYAVGSEATITATPKENCYFIGWSDGVTENPRNVVVNYDTTFTANFVEKPYLTVNANNDAYGTVSGSGYYEVGSVVTITATPNSGYSFVQWSDGNTENPRLIELNTNKTFTAIFRKEIPTTGIENGYEWIDLGLPSGLKWATCNVGASNPEEYGNYYSFRFYDSYEFVDVATKNMGGKWRMPTASEVQELINNCTEIWTTKNGINGVELKGLNNNSIFLPAAGLYIYSSYTYTLKYKGEAGYYWSSTSKYYDSADLFGFYFKSANITLNEENRNYQKTVRAVCP